jgi:hypothetical protein
VKRETEEDWNTRANGRADAQPLLAVARRREKPCVDSPRREVAMPKIEPIEPQDKRVIETLTSALKPFNDFRGIVPLPCVLSFLALVREEGKPIGVYARKLDLERFIIGRYFQNLGNRGRHGTPGLGLVKVIRTRAHPFKTEVYLTAKGRALAAQVVQNLRHFTQE